MRTKMCRLGTKFVTTFQPLSPIQRKAAIIVAVFALLSALAFVFIVLQVIRDATALSLNPRDRTSRSPRILLFRTQLGHYSGCLILSNAFISAAGLIDFYWLSRSRLHRGSTCSVQAVLMQIGIWGTCWFTATHSVHTLISLVFRVRQARWHSAIPVSVGWTIAFAAGLVPMQKADMYGPTGISCGITRSHPKELFFLGALPIILGASASIAVSFVTLIVLYGKQTVNSARRLRGLSSISRRGEDKSEEYRRFIGVVIWTMFWFPLAFVLLLSPFCIIRILVYAEHSIPFPLNVLAEVCAAMLGFVNVGLLCNTFRVTSPISRPTRPAAETVVTFGHDASGESPTVPHYNFYPQLADPCYESSCRTYSSSQTSHSRDSSVDSNTGLMSTEKASYESVKTKLAPLITHIIPPAELRRQLDSKPSTSPPHNNTKRQDNDVRFRIIDSPLYTVSLSPCPPRSAYVTQDTGHESWTQGEKCSFKLVTETDTFGSGADELPESEAPFPLNPPSHSGALPPIPPPVITSKSATLVSRLDIPIASAGTPSRSPTGFSAQKADARAPFPNVRNPGHADEATPRHLPTSSGVSAVTLSTDCGSDYSGQVMYAYKVRPHPRTLQPDGVEEDTLGSLPTGLQHFSAWTQRMTMASVWSQESAYVPDEEGQGAYWELMGGLLDPGVNSGDHQTDGAGVKNRRVTHAARPVTLRIQPVKTPSKRSVCFSNTPKPSDNIRADNSVV